MFHVLYASFTFVPEDPSFLLFPQTAGNHRKVSVLFNRRWGKAGGNCELIAILSIALYNCLCRQGADGTHGGVTLLLFMSGSHMVNVNWGLQQILEQACYFYFYCSVKKDLNWTSVSEFISMQTTGGFNAYPHPCWYVKSSQSFFDLESNLFPGTVLIIHIPTFHLEYCHTMKFLRVGIKGFYET